MEKRQIMDISGIIKDSLRYPFTDWKKILILGLLIVMSSIIGNAISLGYTNNFVIFLLICVGFLTGLFVNGYMFKIIKTSLNEENKLPEFNGWINMLIDGIKVFVVSIVYLAVPTLFIIILDNPSYLFNMLSPPNSYFLIALNTK